jgi:predicted ester cyclase
MDAIDVVREWMRRMSERDYDRLGEVVDLAGYTEICLGLTPWTVGFDVALANYVQNMVRPWADIESVEEHVVVDPETVVIRGHTTARHVGEFLGIAATGRRVRWDWISMVQVRGGRVVGQWAQPDLFAIYRQISDEAYGGLRG